MSGLIVHATVEPGLIILEYTSHGKGVKTGKIYENRYISVVTVRERKVVHWRDYWNQLAVIDAVGSLEPLLEQLTGSVASTSQR
jgi:ketosteroid isomerase-like protein